jgi:hypothetical protein
MESQKVDDDSRYEGNVTRSNDCALQPIVLVTDSTINQLLPIASSKDISTRSMFGKRDSCEEIWSFMAEPSLLIGLVVFSTSKSRDGP